MKICRKQGRYEYEYSEVGNLWISDPFDHPSHHQIAIWILLLIDLLLNSTKTSTNSETTEEKQIENSSAEAAFASHYSRDCNWLQAFNHFTLNMISQWSDMLGQATIHKANLWTVEKLIERQHSQQQQLRVIILRLQLIGHSTDSLSQSQSLIWIGALSSIEGCKNLILTAAL